MSASREAYERAMDIEAERSEQAYLMDIIADLKAALEGSEHLLAELGVVRGTETRKANRAALARVQF